jgi:hypothetical protein
MEEKLHHNCTMDTYRPVGLSPGLPCKVRLGDDVIMVEYEDYDGTVAYRGRADGPGHYTLFCPEKSGRATLHISPEKAVFEGYWNESGERGMWRIKLAE